jgi:hypothetical protein
VNEGSINVIPVFYLRRSSFVIEGKELNWPCIYQSKETPWRKVVRAVWITYIMLSSLFLIVCSFWDNWTNQILGRGLPIICEIQILCAFWLFTNLVPFISVDNWDCIVYSSEVLKLEIHNSNVYLSSFVCILTYFSFHFCLVLSPIGILYVVCCEAMDINAWMFSWDVWCGDGESEV